MINSIASSTSAYISGSRTADGVQPGSILITAANSSTVTATANASSIAITIGAVGASVAIGIGAAQDTITDTVLAYISSATVKTTRAR